MNIDSTMLTDEIISAHRMKEKSFLQLVTDGSGTVMEHIIGDALEEEVTRWTNAGWHERNPDKRTDSRNGYHKPRPVASMGKELWVRVPRTRGVQ